MSWIAALPVPPPPPPVAAPVAGVSRPTPPWKDEPSTHPVWDLSVLLPAMPSNRRNSPAPFTGVACVQSSACAVPSTARHVAPMTMSALSIWKRVIGNLPFPRGPLYLGVRRSPTEKLQRRDDTPTGDEAASSLISRRPH